jgi:hypothetical protein
MGDTLDVGLGGKGVDETRVEMSGPSKPAPSATKKASDAMDPGEIGMLVISGILVVAMVVLPIMAFFVSEWNETNIDAMRSNAALFEGLQCGTYDGSVYTLTRGGISFARNARDEVQFLTGFESACATCPAVPGTTYGTATPLECTGVFDSGANHATRRSKTVECSGDAAFTATLEVEQAIVNRVVVDSRSVQTNTNPWRVPSLRCQNGEWWDATEAAGIPPGVLDVRSALNRARNMYFVDSVASDGSSGIGLCYCQQCHASWGRGASTNSAGASVRCENMAAFAWGFSDNGQALEMCNYAPTGGWGANTLV